MVGAVTKGPFPPGRTRRPRPPQAYVAEILKVNTRHLICAPLRGFGRRRTGDCECTNGHPTTHATCHRRPLWAWVWAWVCGCVPIAGSPVSVSISIRDSELESNSNYLVPYGKFG